MNPARAVVRVISLLLVFACSSAPKGPLAPPETLFRAACPATRPAREVKGSVWIKIDSAELRGQFPATVLAESPDRVFLEVTNLIGSPQASVSVRGDAIDLRLAPGNEKAMAGKAKARPIWGGLPLAWTPVLFLGGVPCPASRVARVEAAEFDEVRVIETRPGGGRSIYTYRMEKWGEAFRVRALEFDGALATGQPLRASMEFSDPDDADGGARRWSAVSQAGRIRGEIKVRWKDRRSALTGR